MDEENKEPKIEFTNPASGQDENRPGFKPGSTWWERKTGTSSEDIGIDRKKILLGATGSIAVVCAVCTGLYLLASKVGGSTTSQEAELSDQYKDLMRDSRVADILNKLRLGNDKTGIENKDTLLYNTSLADDYLQKGGDWQNLSIYLEKKGEPAFLGQMVSLGKANCLLPNGHINVVSCDSNPGFKNLDPKLKQEYIDKYNATFDKIQKAHPELFPSIPPKMSNVPEGRIELQKDWSKFKAAEVRRQRKEFKSTRRNI